MGTAHNYSCGELPPDPVAQLRRERDDVIDVLHALVGETCENGRFHPLESFHNMARATALRTLAKYGRVVLIRDNKLDVTARWVGR